MSQTFTELVTLEKCTCISCGVVFAIPETLIDNLRRNSGFYHCPNGHSQGWAESEAQKLKKQLEAVQVQLRVSKCETLAEQNRRIEAEDSKEKAEKKLRRVKNGVCPCCNRSFQNLARHMAIKHGKNP